MCDLLACAGTALLAVGNTQLLSLRTKFTHEMFGCGGLRRITAFGVMPFMTVRGVILNYIYVYNFMKIRPVGAEFLHADGRTDRQTDRQTDRRDEANNRFSQFYEDP